MQVSGLAPSFYADRAQDTGVDQIGDRAVFLHRLEPEIVAKFDRGRQAQRARRAFDQLTPGIALVGGRQRENRGGDNAIGQVIDALEASPPCRGGQVAGIEQPFERALGIAPFPPSRPAFAMGEVGRGERPLRRDPGEDRVRLRALLGREAA